MEVIDITIHQVLVLDQLEKLIQGTSEASNCSIHAIEVIETDEIVLGVPHPNDDLCVASCMLLHHMVRKMGLRQGEVFGRKGLASIAGLEGWVTEVQEHVAGTLVYLLGCLDVDVIHQQPANFNDSSSTCEDQTGQVYVCKSNDLQTHNDNSYC